MSYPKIFLRIKGMLLDSLLFGLIVYSSVFALMWLGIEKPAIKALFLILPVLIFEPLCVSLSGGSVGHHYAGIKVVDAKTGGHLNIIFSVIRFVLKGVLGLVSLLSVSDLVLRTMRTILPVCVCVQESPYIKTHTHTDAVADQLFASAVLRLPGQSF